MKLLIAGGGTGGHVFPALAVAEEWLSRGGGREVILVGTERGLEARLVPARGLPLETIHAGGLKGIGGARLLRHTAMLLPALWESAAILRRHHCAAALGTGGYASGPMLLMAALERVPTVIFEPNVLPGFANRLLAEMGATLAAAQPATAQHWRRKVVVTGCPVRREFFQAARREHRPPFQVLITGGSQGSLALNRAVVDSLDQLAARKQELFLVHQTGKRDYNAVRVAYARRDFPAEVVPFLENMADHFSRADLIVCRSGAITVAEIAAAGRAALFIPFAAAADGHQLRNAQAMVRAGAARLIEETALGPGRLAQEIFSLLDQPQQISAMEESARALARPNAARDLVDLLEGIARP